MPLTLIRPPVTEPITLAQVKAHCRIEHSTEDTLLNALISTARLAAEHELQRPLITQTWEMALQEFPTDNAAIALNRFRPLSVISVDYLDVNGTDTSMPDTEYVMDATTSPGYVLPAYGVSWPECRSYVNSVRIRFTAGYGSAAAVPLCVKQWMLMMVGSMYAFRESTTDRAQSRLPFINSLLDPERVYL